MSDVVVTIPATADLVHVLRSVVASVAAREGLSIDEIDDLKLAVGESAVRLLADRGGAEELTLSVERAPSELRLRVTATGGTRTWPPADLERTLTWQILPALVDEVGVIDGDDGGFRLTKKARTPEPA